MAEKKGRLRHILDINRAKPEGFLEYMRLRPYYFKELTGKEATEKNIKQEFKNLKKACLVAASNISPHCNCIYCKGGQNDSGRI